MRQPSLGNQLNLMTLQDMHLVLNLIVKDIYEIESMKKVNFLPVIGRAFLGTLSSALIYVVIS